MVIVLAGSSRFGFLSLVPKMELAIGTGYLYLLCFGMGLLTLAFIVFCVPETFGKSLEEIEDHYRALCYGKNPDKQPDKTKEGN